MPPGRYQALLTETDRENIAGGENEDTPRRQVDQSVYRVRKRINEELVHDIDVLETHRPDLLAELRRVVCEDQ